MPALPVAGFRSLIRMEVGGDIVWDGNAHYEVVTDSSVEVSTNPKPEEPPLLIIDALGKLTLHKMQQKAVEAVAKGNVQAATRRLENLATRLLAAGEEDLANAAMAEAKRVAATSALSEEGSKRLKYGTRHLLLADGGRSTKKITDDAKDQTGSMKPKRNVDSKGTGRI